MSELRRSSLGRSEPRAVLWALMAAAIIMASGAAACGGAADDSPLLVFSAVSLIDAMAEIESEFESMHDASLSISFGGSQALAQQIRRGAPADVFVSAGAFQTSELVEDGLVDGGEVDVLRNRLVMLVRPGASVRSMLDLAERSTGRIAIADPALAPAGRYAQEALTTLGLWEHLQDRLVKGVDVRSTMAYVESGNVDAAIVYKTDAAVAEGVLVLDVVPTDSYSPVVYTAVLVRRPGRSGSAEAFMGFLTGETAAGVFRRLGFGPVTP